MREWQPEDNPVWLMFILTDNSQALARQNSDPEGKWEL